MKKLIFLLTIVCSIFLLNGCGTNEPNEVNTNKTDPMIGEWISLNGKGFAKIKITKNNNEYVYTGKTYQVIMQKESASLQSPLVIQIADANSSILDKNNAKLTNTNDKYTLYIDGRESQALKYNSKTNSISLLVGGDVHREFKPTKNITEQEKRKWADEAIKELSNTYKAKRDGEYGIIDKIDLSLIK